MSLNYRYHEYIDTYIANIRQGKIKASKRLKKALTLVERKLNNKDVFIDSKKISECKRVIEKYFKIELLPWQLFIIALIHCYYKSTDDVVFDEFFIMMGRGNGKNGFISPVIWYLTTEVHGIDGYNVDLISNNEDQAKTSFKDVYEMLDRNWKHMEHGFTKTKMSISNKSTRSYIEYNTSNARTKDGKRSACLVFDEIHEYEDYDSIEVFTSGFGKRKHSRAFYITTNGYVRGGVLDQELEKADQILDNVDGIGDTLGMLPLLYELDDEKEVDNEELWEKANPSINYFPELMKEVRKHYIKAQTSPTKAVSLMAKRMNIPKQDAWSAVTTWEKILATNREIPLDKLMGTKCIGALDYAEVTDFASVGLLFKLNRLRYWYEHTFVSYKALKIESRQIKFPVEEMVERGLITVIYDESIQPKHIADWFIEQAKKYHIIDIVADDYRSTYIRQEFTERGLPLSITRRGPITHSKLSPLIQSLFEEETIVFGDNPTMRWYTNNVYAEKDRKGNIEYKKIEPKTRKTDGFFSFIHALTKDDELQEAREVQFYDVITF